MWQLYDRLIEAVPEGSVVEDFFVGRTWTFVKSGGQLGIAMTTAGESVPALLKGNLIGRPLREVAAAVKSWNIIEASIGMAAINSYYNTLPRRNELAAAQNDESFYLAGLSVKGKTIGLVGHLRMPTDALSGAKQVYVLERSPSPGDYPDSACEYLLPQCDIVLITGSALTNKTMPRLLQLSRSAKVILAGPSVPLAPVLLDFGVYCLTGMVVNDPVEMRFLASRGEVQSPYYCGARFKTGIN